MYEQVDQVVSENINPVKVIIERKGNISYKPSADKIPYSSQIAYIMNIPVLDNISDVIKMK